ncbi:virulence RhuM family protein [Desulfosarcina sp. OttesenSCG-928-G10]|nr:virulence RhuM family protein [Desulfosarcina sp. OttesenSCG-928-G10]
MAKTKAELLLYRSSDGSVQLDVQLEQETIWLTLKQLATLFERDKSVVSRHLRNIYKEGELLREATVAKNATVQNEAGRSVVRDIEYYNLDAIISVGYRVNSKRGTEFRIWANNWGRC